MVGLLLGIPTAGPPAAGPGGTATRQPVPPPAVEPGDLPAASPLPAPIVLGVHVAAPTPQGTNVPLSGSPFSVPVCSAFVASGARMYHVNPAFELESGHVLVLGGAGFAVQIEGSPPAEIPLPDGSSLEVSVRSWGASFYSMVDPEEQAALVAAWEEGSSNGTFEPIGPPAGWPGDASWEEAVVLLRAAQVVSGSFDICQ